MREISPSLPDLSKKASEIRALRKLTCENRFDLGAILRNVSVSNASVSGNSVAVWRKEIAIKWDEIVVIRDQIAGAWDDDGDKWYAIVASWFRFDVKRAGIVTTWEAIAANWINSVRSSRTVRGRERRQ